MPLCNLRWELVQGGSNIQLLISVENSGVRKINAKLRWSVREMAELEGEEQVFLYGVQPQ